MAADLKCLSQPQSLLHPLWTSLRAKLRTGVCGGQQRSLLSVPGQRPPCYSAGGWPLVRVRALVSRAEAPAQFLPSLDARIWHCIDWEENFHPFPGANEACTWPTCSRQLVWAGVAGGLWKGAAATLHSFLGFRRLPKSGWRLGHTTISELSCLLMSPPEPQAQYYLWPDTTDPIPSLHPRETETVWSSCTTSWCVQLHGPTKKHSSSTPPLMNLNLKLPPRHKHLPQKCGGAQTGPGQIGDLSSLNCNSMTLPGLHG